MLTVTAAQLRAIAGGKAPLAAQIAESFNPLAAAFGLTTPLRVAHFLAQLAHESAFRHVREIWGPTAAQKRYEGRADLGNTHPGDGERFKGRGLIQVTGRANARDLTAWIRKRYPDAPDFEATPEAMEQFPWALVGAFWFWETRKLNALADRDDVVAVTKKVNGGTNGLADRKAALARAKAQLGVEPAPKAAPVAKKAPAARPAVEPGLPTAPTVEAPAAPAALPWWQRALGMRPPAPAIQRPGLAANGDPALWDIQDALSRLKYPVGLRDGLMGRNTRAAVSAARERNGLPEGNTIDAAFKAALPGMLPAEVSQQRAEAGKAELRQQAPEATRQLDGIGLVGKLIMGASGIGAADASGMLDTFKATADQATETLQSVQAVVNGLVGVIQWCVQHWWILGFVVGAYILARVAMAVLRLVVLLRQGRLL